mmetsp:Transcript_14138/g.38077  ORF Transcript_14138/g.38077 Transcript_14138/m.38077 type:complete len:402 (+) Transcript_14138:147-1352(+)
MAQWFSARFSGRKSPVNSARASSGQGQDAQPAPQPAQSAPQQQRPPAPPPQASAILAGAQLPATRPGGIQNYVIRQTLGVGAFGKVKLAEHKETGQLSAIKCIQKSRISVARQFERLQREIKILKLLRHPNVIQLYEVIETEAEIFLVMEHVSGGDLLDFINSRGAMPEAQARDLFNQITCGLQFCHSLGIAHRDLKPENILINDQGVVKITDFGLSNMQSAGEHLTTLCGSPYYAAPELLDGGTTQYDGTEADIWSVGVITFAILCGELPFDGQTLPDLFAKITAAKYVIPPQLSLSSHVRDLLACMLVRAPSERTRMAQLRNHPWLLGPTRGFQSMTAKGGAGDLPQTASMIMDFARPSLESSWIERNLATVRTRPRLRRSLSFPEKGALAGRVRPPGK